ncbi:flagellar biosynthesis anti-sigma factor FlgM [Fictibacillus terranigra]|uniref:Negative regulator of flagellin synthesis n=1 Tax=Fictibacillus terranigra TaxID=3058424 RepID=A0ABT8E298_9BACL|nr:flagellar biosynthesis anti-sigma factor FlgM [Fictibacillus sp. CENA-BCM004]MDN4072022.1 flagellar biosynthesis anti-sigma factor FlgM [Fictibacillus sp. CENA-BCM004]
MKINSFNLVNINPYMKQNQQYSIKNEEKMKQSDEIQISAEAKDLQSSQQFSASRQDKINEIKIQINSGQYQPDSREIARKFYQFWN